MKTKCKIIISTITQDGNFANIKLDRKAPKDGTICVLKWGRVRSLKQNNLYWQFLDWCMESGLKDEYIDKMELHDQLKGRLLSKVKTGKFEYRTIGSTTDLTVDEFIDYIERCGELIREFCGIDTGLFWVEYANEHMPSNQ